MYIEIASCAQFSLSGVVAMYWLLLCLQSIDMISRSYKSSLNYQLEPRGPDPGCSLAEGRVAGDLLSEEVHSNST